MRKSYREVNGEKVFRYSIRKYHFGAASVAVAALMFFANGAVKADTLPVSPATANTEKVNVGVTELTEGVPPKENPIEKSKEEVVGDKTPVAQKLVDKSPLVQAISELQAAIAKADEESLLSLSNQLTQLTDENNRLLNGENTSEEAIASQVSRVQFLTEQVRLLKSKTKDKASNKEDGSGSKAQDKKEFEVSENAVTLVNQTEEIKKSVKDVKVEEVFNNKTKLETLLKEIDKLDPEKYTEDSVKGLKEKVAKAKEVLTTAKNQEEVNSVYKELVNYKNSSLRRVKTNHKPLEENTPKLDTTNGKETVGKKAQNTEPNDRNIAGHNHILNGTALPEGSGLRAAPNNTRFTYETVGADLSSLVAGEELGYGKNIIIKVKYDTKAISTRDVYITTTPNTGPRTEYTNRRSDGIGPFEGGTNIKLVGVIPNDMIGTYDLHVHVLNNKNNNSQWTTLNVPITVKPKKPTVSVADLVNAEGKKPVVTARVANTSISKVEFYLNGQKQTVVNATNGQATWTPTSALRENDRITVKNIAQGGIPPRDVYGNTFTTREATSDMSDAVVIPRAPKTATPGAPTVVSDTANARVTVTPSTDADRVEVTVGNSTVVATKTGSTWTLSPTKTGVTVDPTSGVVTVAHNAASAGTQVSATAKHGNSDASTAASVALPGKAATPAAPTVASDEANARVTVTPSADADRVEVTVGDATVVATKTGSTWSLTPSKEGVSVDPTSGVITVAHNAASAGTQVSATAKHGNSDASTASTANLPAKETTPNAPTVVSDTANARVTVTPSTDADRVEVTVGNSTVVATKTGSTWSLTPAKEGVSVDPTSGVITVAHNAANAGTQVSATAKHGNSDASTAESVALPGKTTTPVKDVKSDAITEVNKALEAKVKSIELSNEFTVKEKDFLKEKVRKSAILAILKIKAVTNNYDIESEKNEGIERINSVEATAPTMLELPELIVTKWQDENGNILKPNDVKIPFEIGVENEALAHGEIPGYKFIETKSVDEEGVVIHIFKKVTSKIGDYNVESNYNILQSSMLSNIDESSNKVSTTKVEKISKRLANTGTTESNSGLTGLGLAVFGGLLAVTRKYREKINNG